MMLSYLIDLIMFCSYTVTHLPWAFSISYHSCRLALEVFLKMTSSVKHLVLILVLVSIKWDYNKNLSSLIFSLEREDSKNKSTNKNKAELLTVSKGKREKEPTRRACLLERSMYFIVPQMTGHYIQRDIIYRAIWGKQGEKTCFPESYGRQSTQRIEKLNSLTKILAGHLSKTSSSDAEMWRPKLLLIVLFQVS